jgi:mRNA interferase ChpB
MERGDVYLVDLDPVKGTEQAGNRPVLVISRASFNRLGVAVVCPISRGGSSARSRGWSVSLSAAGMKTYGVVLCHQPRTLDLKARNGRKVETAPESVIDEVLAKLQTIID